MAGGIDVPSNDQSYDRMEMLRAFDETKAGVKGLIDSGLLKIPRIFVRPSEELAQELTCKKTQVQVPVIDLSGIQEDADRRKRIVEEVRIASETWGFFQVVNHGIPLTVLDRMIEGVWKFNEQDVEEKKKYYSRDRMRTTRFNSSYDLFQSRTASWRDTLIISFLDPDEIDHDELPTCCRDSALEYSKHVEILGNILLGLLSEALGLKTDHLNNMECSQGHRLHCHYSPACPEPELGNAVTEVSLKPIFILDGEHISLANCIETVKLSVELLVKLISFAYQQSRRLLHNSFRFEVVSSVVGSGGNRRPSM